MANYGLNIQNLHLSDDGPPKPARTPTLPQRSNSPVDQDARDAALRAELAGVQNINKVIEGVIESLEKAKANMETVSSTVNSANALLNLWVRVLSQAEHTQRLLLSGHWEGASKDLNDIEAEALAKAQESERKKEEERLRAAARERERQRTAAAREAGESESQTRSGRTYKYVRGRIYRGAGSSAGGSRVPAPSGIPSAETSGTRGTSQRGLKKGGGRLGSAGRGVK